MTLLIDADYLIYNSCCACEQDTRWNECALVLIQHSDMKFFLNIK